MKFNADDIKLGLETIWYIDNLLEGKVEGVSFQDADGEKATFNEEQKRLIKVCAIWGKIRPDGVEPDNYLRIKTKPEHLTSAVMLMEEFEETGNYKILGGLIALIREDCWDEYYKALEKENNETTDK